MELQLKERVGCSWLSENRATSAARKDFATSAAWHDAHGEDFTTCDAWLCVCGATDGHGGTWETTDVTGRAVEPIPPWRGALKCTSCGRVYDHEGYAIDRSAANSG